MKNFKQSDITNWNKGHRPKESSPERGKNIVFVKRLTMKD